MSKLTNLAVGTVAFAAGALAEGARRFQVVNSEVIQDQEHRRAPDEAWDSVGDEGPVARPKQVSLHMPIGQLGEHRMALATVMVPPEKYAVVVTDRDAYFKGVIRAFDSLRESAAASMAEDGE